MQNYIRQQNLALFKRELAQPHSDSEREILIKLLVAEKAKAFLATQTPVDRKVPSDAT